jgi:hypothetical protein
VDVRSQFGTMPETLEASTGRSLDDWLETVRAMGLDKHGQILAALKTEHGLSHGYANMLALIATGYGQQTEDEIVAGLFAGPKACTGTRGASISRIIISYGDPVYYIKRLVSTDNRTGSSNSNSVYRARFTAVRGDLNPSNTSLH